MEKDMVQVQPVGVKGGLLAKDSNPEDAEGVEDGYGENPEGNGGCGLNGADGTAREGGFEEVDYEKGDDESEYQGTRVAHENFLLLRENVEVDECKKGTGYRASDDDQLELAVVIKPYAEGYGYDTADSGRKAIDAIGEVDGVNNAQPGYECKENTRKVRKCPHPEKSMKARDTHVTKNNDHQHCGDLPK